jgi:hypothetical protein
MLLPILFSACNRPEAPDCLKSAGEATQEERDIQGFIQHLHVDDLVHVKVFHSGGNDRIVVRGPRNLLPSLITETDGGKLSIRNENTCNWVRKFSHRLEVDVYCDQLQAISYAGQGDILVVDSITAPRFVFENRLGSGDVLLRVDVDTLEVIVHTGYSPTRVVGRASLAFLFNQGIGRFDARELITPVVSCNNSSINTMEVYAASYLYAYIGAQGNVWAHGNPPIIEVKRDGTGELILIPE